MHLKAIHSYFAFHRLFWVEHPALLLAISVLIGMSSALFWGFPWNWIFPLLWSSYLIFIRRWVDIGIILVSAIYASCLYPIDSIEPDKLSKIQIGYFSITTVQPHRSPFQKSLLFKGTLHIDKHSIPCSISHSLKNPPKANCDYIVKGQLQQRAPYAYFFKAKEWIPVENTWSLAQMRFQMKEKLRNFLDQRLKRHRTSAFLGSLITGDVEDRSLRYEFGKLGLQHILAISGFHFAILIAFCSFFLGLFLPYRWKIFALILCLNVYFLFVGSLPAVQRSWLMAMLYLVGKLIGRHSTGLNLLGVAILIEALLDPLVISNLGFQLSFTSCVGILLFRHLFTKPIYALLPHHPIETLSPFAQHVYLISSFLRQGLSINFSVNLAILPLLLYTFHQFPLLSLLYNLFFPLLVTTALFGLLFSFLIHCLLPTLSPSLFNLIDWVTAQILDLSAYPPLPLDYSLSVSALPAWIIPFYLFAFFCFSLTNSRHFK